MLLVYAFDRPWNGDFCLKTSEKINYIGSTTVVMTCSKHPGSSPNSKIQPSYDILKFRFFLLLRCSSIGRPGAPCLTLELGFSTVDYWSKHAQRCHAPCGCKREVRGQSQVYNIDLINIINLKSSACCVRPVSQDREFNSPWILHVQDRVFPSPHQAPIL